MAKYRKIPLKNTSRYAIVDAEDFDLVDSFGVWYESDTGYAVKKTKRNGKNVSFRMHRVIMNPPKGLEIDHINGKRLDNRKSNLRCVSHQINTWNKEYKEPHTKYDLPRGISYDGQRKKFIAKKTIMKRFDTLEEAIKFYNESEVLDYERK